MDAFCKVYCSGSVLAPYDWITSVPLGINRLVYINGGDGGFIKDNQKIPLKKDCLCLFPGNAHFVKTYSSYEKDENRLDHAYVNFEMVPPIVSKEVFCLEDLNDPEIRVAVETFKTFCVKSTQNGDFDGLDKTSQEYLKSTVMFLVDKIIQKFNCETIKDEVIIKSLKLMHENLGKKQSIEEIAKSNFLSTDGFIRRFKRQVGETPYSYLKKLKIRVAQNMRLNGATLQEIAEKCGYSDSSSLLHAIGRL